MASKQWVGGDFNDMSHVPGVAVASRDPNQIDFFFFGLDARLRHKAFKFENKLWKLVLNENLPTKTDTGIEVRIQGVAALTTQGPNLYDVFVWGLGDNHLYHLAKNSPTAWLNWSKITSGMISSSPSVVAVTKNRLDVFFKDSKGQVATTHWAPGESWSDW